MSSNTKDLRAEVEAAAADLAHLNGAGDPDKLIELVEGSILTARLERIARRELDAEGRPDFTGHLKDGKALSKQERQESERYLIEKITDWGSTNLIIAPTESGGSTFQLHLAYCFLTGLPVLGQFKVPTEERFSVLWINPEEKETTPVKRLKKMGLSHADLAHFHHLHTRDQRLYFNRPTHVDALLEVVEAMDIPPEHHLIVFVDGLAPTLTGKVWNEDLEDWKNGIGQMREALEPVALYVRTQTTARGQRSSKRGGGRLNAEDASGGQIVQWPDNRLTVNRQKDTPDNLLTVRGRLQDGEWDVSYEWDAKTYQLTASSALQKTWASVELERYMAKTEGKADGLTSARAIAEKLADGKDKPSPSTFRRALEAWELSEEEEGTWVKVGR